MQRHEKRLVQSFKSWYCSFCCKLHHWQYDNYYFLLRLQWFLVGAFERLHLSTVLHTIFFNANENELSGCATFYKRDWINTLKLFGIVVSDSCFPVRLMHVIKSTEEKWNCGECGEMGQMAKGSETIKRKSSKSWHCLVFRGHTEG